MSIVVFVLKLMEALWHVSLTNDYSAVYGNIANKDCFFAGIFSILLLIPIVYLIIKNMKDKRAFIEMFLILTIYLISWIVIFFITFNGNYPINIKITRFMVTIANLTVWALCLSKWSVCKKDTKTEEA